MILARDQYGRDILLEGKHPRKELLSKLGAKKASRIYEDRAKMGVDDKGNLITETIHVGYIIRGRWFKLYHLTEWTGVKSKP